MGRHQARETALQTLYQVEVGKNNVEEALKTAIEEFSISEKDGLYAQSLVAGILERKASLDEVINKVTVDWNLERLAKIDLNIIRIALYEILFQEDVPAKVAVNEAVEIAKTFSGEEAGKFVNGILGKIIENRKESGE